MSATLIRPLGTRLSHSTRRHHPNITPLFSPCYLLLSTHPNNTPYQYFLSNDPCRRHSCTGGTPISQYPPHSSNTNTRSDPSQNHNYRRDDQKNHQGAWEMGSRGQSRGQLRQQRGVLQGGNNEGSRGDRAAEVLRLAVRRWRYRGDNSQVKSSNT